MRVKPNPQTLRIRLLVEIINEKLDIECSLTSIDEKSEIAISFYKELKFRYDQQVQAEQNFKNTVECLLKYHDNKVKQYAKHLKSDDFRLLTLRACNQYWNKLAADHYREVYNIFDLILYSYEEIFFTFSLL